MASESFNLALILTLKDMASGGLARFSQNLKNAGQQGAQFHSEFEDLRNDLNRDLSIGGAGIAGLALLKKGVDEAGNYEATLLDLKSAYQEVEGAGGRSMTQQKRDLTELTALATKLGGDLAGNTSSYVEILSALKKAGLKPEDVLGGGAGTAASHLANLNKTIGTPLAAEGAKELGQYGKMFDLGRGQNDYKKAVDLFSALKDRFDVSSSELIEGSKYFASTAKTAMDLRGFEGAAEVAKLIAFSKRYTGYEGSRSGTNLDAVISQFVQHPEAVKALEQKAGIKLELFGADGKFKGDTAEQRVETLFREVEKLRALKPKDRLETINAIFGVEGGRIVGQMAEQGVAGYRAITAAAKTAVPVQDKIIAQMATYNAKTEALAGSWQNLKATAFTPLMDSSKTFLDTSSQIINTLQKYSAENPGLMKTLGTLALYGTTAMVVYSGFKMLTMGVRSFRMASAFSRGDGLLPYLNQTNSALNQTVTASNTASRSVRSFVDASGRSFTTGIQQARTFRESLAGISGSRTLKVGLQIGAIAGLEMLISRAVEGYIGEQTRKEEARNKLGEDGKKFSDRALAYSMLVRPRPPFANQGPPEKWSLAAADPKAAADMGKKVFDFLNRVDNELIAALRGETAGDRAGIGMTLRDPSNLTIQAWDTYAKATGALNWEQLTGSRATPFGWLGPGQQRVGNQYTTAGGSLNVEALVKALRALPEDSSLREPSAMAGFLYYMRKNFPAEKVAPVEEAAKKTFVTGDTYEQALKLIPHLEKMGRDYTGSKFGEKPIASTFGERLLSIHQPMKGTELFSGQPAQTSPTPPIQPIAPPPPPAPLHMDTLSQSFLDLSQPVANNVQNFTNLHPQVTPNVTTFQQLVQPTTDTNQAFSNLIDPANRMPGSFTRINTSVGSVAESLLTLSASIASWRPPASPGAIGPDGQRLSVVNAPSKAVGGNLTHSGLAYVHANEQIVPARATAFRDTLGQSMLTTLSQMKREEVERQTSDEKKKSFLRSISETSAYSQLTEIFKNPVALSPGSDKTEIIQAFIDAPRQTIGGSSFARTEDRRSSLEQRIASYENLARTLNLSQDDIRQNISNSVGGASSMNDLTTITSNNATRTSNYGPVLRAESPLSRPHDPTESVADRLFPTAATPSRPEGRNAEMPPFSFTYNPSITINGNADKGTVTEIKAELERHGREMQARQRKHLERLMTRITERGRNLS